MNPTIKARIESIRRGEVPEGYKRTKIGIVPNEWKEYNLGDFLEEYKEKTIIPNQYPVLTSSRKGLMLQKKYYSQRQVTTDDNIGYNVIPLGFITYRSRSDDGRFCFNENTIIEKGIISYFYPVFSVSANAVKTFVLYLMNETIYRRMIPYAEGTAQQVLSLKQLCSLKYFFPTVSEQEKIAEILAGQDRVIALKEELLAEKQKQKKYLMQQLLTGKKRLPGFSGEWRIVKLKEVLRERDEKNVDQNLEICSVAVQKGVVNQIEHLGRSFAASDTSNYNMVLFGDIVYTKSPTGEFPFGIIKQSQLDKVAVSPLYGVFKPATYALGYILHCYFEIPINTNNYLNPIIQKGAKNTINISNTTFLSNKLLLPMDEKEQTAIAEILSTADNEIELLKKDIEQEKLKKKSLMQLLLTGIVRVDELVS